MKKLLSILMCVSLLSFSFYSCGSDDDDDDNGGNGGNGDITLRVTARYQKTDTGADTFADKGAKVYLFTDVTPNSEYVYELGGNYITPRGDKIKADKSAIIGDNGIVDIIPTFTNRPVTVIIESAFYPEKYDQGHIGNLSESTTYSVVFKP